ncbi:GIY-YIG nuclease family protein [Rhodonellum ikkaensis]|uniref:Endonuclease n=1 Tax=Rhodonellum ikkaensis TaxID=336829 RepID=A0A1H3P8K7_9BACT|nr:GIY-YIG nuclease family protein [Rhodonellum ikkaensis]SDY97370.1 putative endonuclease [Rhodonellum ikkaensis]
MAYHFYILNSRTLQKYYLGHTGEVLEERLRKHNSNHKGFTGRANDWEVIYFEPFGTKSSAYRRELEVKSWKSKARVEALIKGHLPDFKL